jgi:hypothetical protein
MRWRTPIPGLLIALTLACISGPFNSVTAQYGDQRSLDRKRSEINRKTLPYTKRLPSVDKVELLKIGSTNEGGEILSIAATKVVEDTQARTIARKWRSQAFDLNYRAMCHEPPYAIRFFSRGKVVLYASICWACSNIVILEPVVSGQGFKSDSRAANNLLRIFANAFPG